MAEARQNLSDRLLVFKTEGPKEHFFGYHDKSPLDKKGGRLLCLRVDSSDSFPEYDDFAEVGYWNIEARAFHKLDETQAFNWQQGCMLQWLGPDFDRYIIYNKRNRDGKLVSVVHDTATNDSSEIPLPVYSVHPAGSCAVTIDFERLHEISPGYHYAFKAQDKGTGDALEGDGIWFVDLKTKETRRLISTKQMSELDSVSSAHGRPNALVHLLFNKSGSRFLFHHRWVLEDGGIFTRLYSSNLTGTDVHCLLDSGKATHFCWRNDRQVLVWGSLPGVLNKLRKNKYLVKTLFRGVLPLYHRMIGGQTRINRHLVGSHYLLIDDKDSSCKPVIIDILDEDGHPMWNPIDQNLLITDTYQDANNFRKLLLYDHGSKKLASLGEFYSPPELNNTPMRCDLHPRWDLSGRYVCIDSMHEGSRQVYLLDIERLDG